MYIYVSKKVHPYKLVMDASVKAPLYYFVQSQKYYGMHDLKNPY